MLTELFITNLRLLIQSRSIHPSIYRIEEITGLTGQQIKGLTKGKGSAISMLAVLEALGIDFLGAIESLEKLTFRAEDYTDNVLTFIGDYNRLSLAVENCSYKTEFSESKPENDYSKVSVIKDGDIIEVLYFIEIPKVLIL